jgi:hypothetical protein
MKIKSEDGVILALAGVAVYMIMKTGGIKLPTLKSIGLPATFASLNPFKPASGTAYNPADPGAYIPNAQLINGTIHDYYAGDMSSYRTPTLGQIFDDVLSDTYTPGASRPGEFMRAPGAYW